MKKTPLRTMGLAAAAFAAVLALPVRAANQSPGRTANPSNDAIDYAGLARIKAEGMQNSQVMTLASWLTDVYGPRLSGSPNIQKAGEWAVAEMKKWGLQNVALEPWADTANTSRFPRGWTNEKFYLAAVSPQSFPMTGMTSGWSAGTNGPIRGEAVLITTTDPAEIQKLAGTLRGKFVLTQAPPDVAAFWTPQASRYTKEQLDAMEGAPTPPEFGLAAPGAAGRGNPGRAGGAPGGAPAGPPFNRNEFFLKEGVAGVLTTSARGHGLFTIGGSPATEPTSVPAIVVAAEHYGRVARMLQKNLPVTLEADIKNTYTPNPTMFNVVGEIPGTDKADEIVMLGAHFDSWHSATGATDNAAGSAAMMEAMRILKTSGVRLRRTVRIGLWNGEEQGLIGSRDYVAAHFAGRGPAPAVPAGAATGAGGGGRGGGGGAQGSLVLKPAHAKFAGYFNIDNGTGAIRGVYLQGNPSVAPIFRAWMEPLRDLGATHLNPGNTGGTDHQSFDGVGLPGFQFIQDSVEYNTVTHHYNMDSYERLQPEDMRRNATLAAAFAFLTANREELLPRKPAAPAGAGRGGRGGGQ
ncbi:MAG TPA: M20/M25/M40 family metallo-hydrolase [Vicinamibacterales bacterium]|nr:M20/M25/M40 family metallo-hydrolase [Vicinamibacterales bacterium]